MTATELILRGVTRSFGGVRAVSELSLAVPDASVTALLGPNGAGKTTIFNLISGFTRLDAGEIWYGDRRIDGLPTYEVARLGIGRFFQNVRLFQRLTGLENVQLAMQDAADESIVRMLVGLPKSRRRERALKLAAREHLATLGLEELADRPTAALSYGQQKLLALARLLALDARVLLLDEPLAGLSPRALDRMLALVRSAADAGRMIVLIEHNFDAVRSISDRVAFLSQGTLLAYGSFSEVLDDPRVAEEYLGARP